MITARPLVDSDLPAVIALLHAYDRRWFGGPLLSETDLRTEWGSAAFDPGRDGEGWDEDGALVAFGTLGTAGGIELGVRDDWAGAGLEAAVLQRWEDEARRRGLDAVSRDLPADDQAGRDLLEGRGWSANRTGWLLELAAATPVESRPLPAGYAVRELRETDVGAAYDVVREGFTPYGGTIRPFADWRAHRLDRPDVALASCRVATWGDELVGVCLVEDPLDLAGSAAAVEPDAWVSQVAVRPAHRRRGLARELLARTTLAARDRGVPSLTLYTHSGTGALGLYEGFGMVVRHTLVEYGLDLRP